MINTILNTVIPYLDITAPLVTLFFVLFRKEKKLGEHVYIVIFLLAQLLLNLSSKYIMLFGKPPNNNNLFLYQVNSCVSFIIISLYFHARWKHYFSRTRLSVLYIIFTFVILLLLAMVLYEDRLAYNSRSSSLVALLICVFTSSYYYSKLNKPEVEHITSTRSFWIVTGLFLYYGGCFFIFSSYMLLSQNKTPNTSTLWLVHNIIFTMMCILFIIGFRCNRSQQI